jgi:hypothetical protein
VARAGSLSLVAAGLAGLVACSFSREFKVSPHELNRPLPGGLVNSFNLEEQLARGFVPEVLEFLSGTLAKSLDSTRFARVLGQALLERGDFRGCRPHLERAFAEEGRGAERGDIAWLLSQSAYWTGDFKDASSWARRAQGEGRRVPDGWIVYLLSQPPDGIYGGTQPGTRFMVPMSFGRPNLPRVGVKVNDHPAEDLVLDSGASLSLLTQSAARRLGVEAVPGAVTGAYGLHRVEIPLILGWARVVNIGGLTLRNVPFGILSDDALSFQTATAGALTFSGVLGAHLMKELDWRLEFQQSRLYAVRLDPTRPRGSRRQNIFFRRMKPMVRASFNQEPWSLFLLDTGSEPTMVTRLGLKRNHADDVAVTYPQTLEGIGKSRVSWGKVSNITVGVDRFMVRFRDLIVKEEGEGIEDGVLGVSFFSKFDVEIRFDTMTLGVENPLLRRLQEAEAAGPLPSQPPPPA